MITPSISPNCNKNYLAKIFLMQERDIKKHPNADRLSIVEVDFMPVISNNPVANQWYVFFPTECQINADYLAHTNSYRDKEFNKDPEATPGFFEKNGRVKTVKLRGEYSTGYITPLSSVEEFIGQEIEKKEVYFDMLDVLQFVKKYRKPFADRGEVNGQPRTKSDKKSAKLNVVEGQFQFHESTENLRKNIFMLYPEDVINVSFKYHGCLKANQTIKMFDGSLKKIKDIQIGDSVLGFNHETQEFVSSKVTQTFKNGGTKIWTRVFVDTDQTNIYFESRQSFGNETTPEHKYYVKDKGYVLAKNLEIDDKLKLYYDRFDLPSEVIQFLQGKMLGDASLNSKSKYRNLTLCQKEDHLEYLEHCINVCDIFHPIIDTRISGYGTVMKRCNSLYDNSFLDIFKDFIKDGKKVFPEHLELTPIILAYWYMDDGSLSHHESQKDRANIAICGFCDEDIPNIKKALDNYGFNNYSLYKDSGNYWRLRFNHSDAYILFNDIYKYIPPVMRYKLPAEFRNLEMELLTGFTKKIVQDYIFLPISKIETKEELQSSGKYDIETETHNYITSNILVHNSSAIHANLLHERTVKAKWYQKLVGVKDRVEQYYDYIASSRKVIKSDPNLKDTGYYKEDIWSHVLQEIKDRIPKGWTIYSEIVGYLPSGAMIQKDYDYGYDSGTYGVIPYRITVTNSDGDEVELSPEQIIEWSKKNGLVPMHSYFTGTIKDHYDYLLSKHFSGKAAKAFVDVNEIKSNEGIYSEEYKEALTEFRAEYLHMLEAEYNEKDCPICINKVPEEGIIIRKLKHPSKFEALKLKSKRFLLGESLEESASIEDSEN